MVNLPNSFDIVDHVYSDQEVDLINSLLERFLVNKPSDTTYSIRQLLKNVPELKPLLNSKKLGEVLEQYGLNFSDCSKGIFFDKPEGFNWFVGYHQDLSISVKEKLEANGFSKWTTRDGQVGVIPPVKILENTLTVRVHLDDVTKDNGALRVVPESHQEGIQRVDGVDTNKEVLCEVNSGGVLLMSPLTFHASNKSDSQSRRRIIHLEFCKEELTGGVKWLEKN